MNKLAIGITTYNNADNIENISNIYNLDGISVYVVDDYSTDGTVELLKNKGIDCMLPLIKAGGPGAGRNMIIRKAHTAGNKFIAFIDGDDAAIIDNLKILANKINNKYDMYYTPMLVRGYNDALIPLGSSNFTYEGKVSTKKLKTSKFEKLRYKLLLGSGGRVYSLDIIIENNLLYDPNKSGQDTLFNHEYFECIKNVYFNDVTKPFYIYDIQMESLSNNYNLDVLNNRLELIDEISKYPYSIHTNKEYADKSFVRYTSTYFVEEEMKLKFAKTLTEFTGNEYNYVPSKDYLTKVEVVTNFKRGINVVLVNCDLVFPQHELLNVIKVNEITRYQDLTKLLTYEKTIILDKSILQVDYNYLIEMSKSSIDIIQPKYLTPLGESAQHLNNNIYHGFSNSGVCYTYTYVGMIFDTRLLLNFDFSFTNHYELLVKSLFLNAVIPKINNTAGFYMNMRKVTKFYRDSILESFRRSYFANTRAKFLPYQRLMSSKITKGNFIGVDPSYQSSNLSFEEQSFIETELLEFSDFEGAYVVDHNNNIIETTSMLSIINFSNMIFGKKISNGVDTIGDKELINIPSTYKLLNNIMIKFSTFAVGVKKSNYVCGEKYKSDTFLMFDTDVIKCGAYCEFVKLVNEEGKVFCDKDFIPKGKYQFLVDDTNSKYIDKLKNVKFVNSHLYNNFDNL